MKPYAVCVPTLTSLTSSALPFAPSTPATLVSLLSLGYTRHAATGPLHLPFPLPRTLSPGYPHGSPLLPPSFSKVFTQISTCQRGFPDHSFENDNTILPRSHFISLHSTEHHLTCYLSYFSFVFPQKECRFHAGREWLEHG